MLRAVNAPIAERLLVLAKCVLPSFSDELLAIAVELERVAEEMRCDGSWPYPIPLSLPIGSKGFRELKDFGRLQVHRVQAWADALAGSVNHSAMIEKERNDA